MNVMSYKGFAASVEFDAEDGLFVGHVAGLNDRIGFHAHTTDDLVAGFREAVDDYLETCEKLSRPPEKPFSGQLMVRVDPEVHAKAAAAAQLKGQSLAKWTEDRLRQAAEVELASAAPV